MISGAEIWEAENQEDVRTALKLLTQVEVMIPGPIMRDARIDRLRKVLECAADCCDTAVRVRARYDEGECEATIITYDRMACLQALSALMARELCFTVTILLPGTHYYVAVHL